MKLRPNNAQFKSKPPVSIAMAFGCPFRFLLHSRTGSETMQSGLPCIKYHVIAFATATAQTYLLRMGVHWCLKLEPRRVVSANRVLRDQYLHLGAASRQIRLVAVIYGEECNVFGRARSGIEAIRHNESFGHHLAYPHLHGVTTTRAVDRCDVLASRWTMRRLYCHARQSPEDVSFAKSSAGCQPRMDPYLIIRLWHCYDSIDPPAGVLFDHPALFRTDLQFCQYVCNGRSIDAHNLVIPFGELLLMKRTWTESRAQTAKPSCLSLVYSRSKGYPRWYHAYSKLHRFENDEKRHQTSCTYLSRLYTRCRATQ